MLATPGLKRQAALNRLLFPGPTKEFEAHREIYGDTSRLSANQFFYGLRHGDEHRIQIDKGVDLIIGLEAISDADERGMRTVMCIINGQLRPVVVRDQSVAVDVPVAEKADRTNPDHVAAPFAGVVTVNVSADDDVEAGQTIATIEAMKMEAAITAPKAGIVARVAVSATAQVEGGDLLVVVSPAGRSEATGGRIRRAGAKRPGERSDPDRRRPVRRSPNRRAAERFRSRSGTGTRPTTDRVRESLFNVLDARMELAGAVVLDLYAGSGALGIEALSRGAASATFVESDRRAAAVITSQPRRVGSHRCHGPFAPTSPRWWQAARCDLPTWSSPIRRTKCPPPTSRRCSLRSPTAAGWQTVRSRWSSGRRPARHWRGRRAGRRGVTAATATPGWSSATSARRALVHARKPAEIA